MSQQLKTGSRSFGSEEEKLGELPGAVMDGKLTRATGSGDGGRQGPEAAGRTCALLNVRTGRRDFTGRVRWSGLTVRRLYLMPLEDVGRYFSRGARVRAQGEADKGAVNSSRWVHLLGARA